MEETPATQYFFSPNNAIYHLVESENATLCGRYVLGKPEQRRRRDDLRIVNEKPEGRFVALCRQCQGLPDYELVSPELRYSRILPYPHL